MNRKLVLAALFLMTAACGAAVDPASPGAEADLLGTQDESAQLSAARSSLVSLRLDTRQCFAPGPSCGGYWVRDLNKEQPEQYVSGLDFTHSGLSAAEATQVEQAPAEDLVLRGKLGPVESTYGTRPLLVTEVYRGMPGIRAAAADGFFWVQSQPQMLCVRAPCETELLHRANASGPAEPFSSYDTRRAASRLVDAGWLVGQVKNHRAIVSAALVIGTDGEKVLDASQVYVRWVKAPSACSTPGQACSGGSVAGFSRDAELCLVQTACVPQPVCPQSIPACDTGYRLSSWTGETGCPRFACDPDFL